MQSRGAARYARWAAGAAVVLAAITLGVYLHGTWVAYRNTRKAPPPTPPSVQRQSTGLKFSKVDGNRTIFELQASRSTEFKGNGENLLEDVRITIFGQTGQRHDTMHTTSCKYTKDSGQILCSGDVQIDLQNAADFEQQRENSNFAARVVHVETRGVSFNRESGIAETNEAVRFVFPGGQGNAAGVRYQSAEGILRLERNVRLNLRPPRGMQGAATPPLSREVSVRGASLEYRRDAQALRLIGPAEAQTEKEKLTAGELTLLLDAGYRAQRLVASAGTARQRPEILSQGSRGEFLLSADSLTARFGPEGWVESMEAAGSVRGSLTGAAEQQQLQSDRMEMQLAPRVNKPHELTVTGNVTLASNFPSTGEARTLETSSLRVLFSAGEKNAPSRPERAETLAPGTVRWTERSPASGTPPTQTKVSADRLGVNFGTDGRAQKLDATGNVHTERQIPGRPLQTATSRSGITQLGAGAGWERIDLQDEVKLKEGDRTAQAKQAAFYRADKKAVLTGSALVRDASVETQAQRITFFQGTGEIRAEGTVRSTDLSPRTSTVHLAPQVANLSAETLVANSQTGRALYTGHARLWQGDSVLEADSIELVRDPRGLNATGNVRAVFPQTALKASPAEGARASSSKANTVLWNLQAGSLNYRDTENRAHLEKNVRCVSDTQKLRASALDLYFNRSGDNGAQQLSRAIGTGGVTVEQGDRRGSAERGEYTAAEGKFVLSGGTPTLYDALRGTTTGRQLTFFLADDTILVDSENGSRTLTKHRVEK